MALQRSPFLASLGRVLAAECQVVRRMTARAIRMVSPVAAGVLAVWGGVFFGLFSCGGYVWHWQLFEALLGVAMIATVVAPPWQLRSWPRRGVFVLALACGFVLTRAVASCFYPATPTSFGEFGRDVIHGLLRTPC